ncbi:MAG: hypothetical protein K6T83_00125 [Alicyclobacillus sp.]|nr:hypothetical protein [Alicyclobacillus sp.]
MADIYWPDVWHTVASGFSRHEQILERMLEEWNALREQGYGDPLDGFLSTALHAHRLDTVAVFEAVEQKNAAGLLQALTRVLAGVARYYSESDLDWSVAWEQYQNEFGHWLDAIRAYVELGHNDKDAFIEYTTRRWTV